MASDDSSMQSIHSTSNLPYPLRENDATPSLMASNIQRDFRGIYSYLKPILHETRIFAINKKHWLTVFPIQGLAIMEDLSKSIILAYYFHSSLGKWIEHFMGPLTAPTAQTQDLSRDVLDLITRAKTVAAGLLKKVDAIENKLVTIGGQNSDGSINTKCLKKNIEEAFNGQFDDADEAGVLIAKLKPKVERFLSFRTEVEDVLGYWNACATQLREVFEKPSSPDESMLKKKRRIAELQTLQTSIVEYMVEIQPVLRESPEAFQGALKWIKNLLDGGLSPTGEAALHNTLGRPQDPLLWNVTHVELDSRVLVSGSQQHKKTDFLIMDVSSTISSVKRLKPNFYAIKARVSALPRSRSPLAGCRCTMMTILWTFHYRPGRSTGYPIVDSFEPRREDTHPSQENFSVEKSFSLSPQGMDVSLFDASYKQQSSTILYHQGRIQGSATLPSKDNKDPDRVNWSLVENSSTNSGIDECSLGVVLKLETGIHEVIAKMSIFASYESHWKDTDHFWSIRHTDSFSLSATGAHRILDLPLLTAREAIEDVDNPIHRNALNGTGNIPPVNANRPKLSSA